MTADAQARGEAERYVESIEKVSPPLSEFDKEACIEDFIAGYRAAEEKAKGETRAAVIEELHHLARTICFRCEKQDDAEPFKHDDSTFVHYRMGAPGEDGAVWCHASLVHSRISEIEESGL